MILKRALAFAPPVSPLHVTCPAVMTALTLHQTSECNAPLRHDLVRSRHNLSLAQKRAQLHGCEHNVQLRAGRRRRQHGRRIVGATVRAVGPVRYASKRLRALQGHVDRADYRPGASKEPRERNGGVAAALGVLAGLVGVR